MKTQTSAVARQQCLRSLAQMVQECLARPIGFIKCLVSRVTSLVPFMLSTSIEGIHILFILTIPPSDGIILSGKQMILHKRIV